MARLQAKDGEYKKQDLVTIEMDAFRAMLFAPEKLNAKANAMPGVLAQARDDIVEEQYIVTVRRIQGTWEYTIHHDGAEIKLPSEVIDRINKSRDLIISRGRKDAARNRLQRVAAGDQAAAAREPDNAAGAMSFLGVDDDDDLDQGGSDDVRLFRRLRRRTGRRMGRWQDEGIPGSSESAARPVPREGLRLPSVPGDPRLPGRDRRGPGNELYLR